MDLIDIEIFRSLLTTRNISQTSKLLLLPQSTISQRLARLEAEVGVALFLRQKGVRGLEATERALLFAELAEKWEDSYQRLLHLRDAVPQQTLVAASPDSINNFVLMPFWRLLPSLGFHPRVRTHQSNEIYDLVDNRQADVGFVFSEAHFPNVRTQVVLRERIVMICRPGSPWKRKAIRPDELDKQNEVFLAWSPEIERWHDSWWKPSDPPLVRVDTPALVLDFLVPGTWAMCPASVAATHEKNGFEVHCFTDEPPLRTCWFIRHKSPSQRQADVVARFTSLLLEHIAGLSFSLQ